MQKLIDEVEAYFRWVDTRAPKWVFVVTIILMLAALTIGMGVGVALLVAKPRVFGLLIVIGLGVAGYAAWQEYKRSKP